MARSCNKQDEGKSGGKLRGQTGNSGTKKQFTVIAIHKKTGEENINKFKEDDRKIAIGHTWNPSLNHIWVGQRIRKTG
jgi:hypothetical protein